MSVRLLLNSKSQIPWKQFWVISWTSWCEQAAKHRPGKHRKCPSVAFSLCRFGAFDCSWHVLLGVTRPVLNHAALSEHKALHAHTSALLGNHSGTMQWKWRPAATWKILQFLLSALELCVYVGSCPACVSVYLYLCLSPRCIHLCVFSVSVG